jgi:hypothetical protein
MNNTVFYETENLKLFTIKTPVTILTTDKGFFTDTDQNNIGKIVQVFKILNEDGSISYEPKYDTVIQHFPGDYS